MKNIEEILKELGIEIPEDKKEAFSKVFHENYKTIKEFNGINEKLTNATSKASDLENKYNTDIKQRDDDLADLKAKLEKAGASEDTIKQLTGDLETLQVNYDKAKQEYEEKLQKQAYEFAVKEQSNELKFSSNSAKKAFISDLLSNPLQMRDGALIGFTDYLNAYKEQDADAFLSEDSSKDASVLEKPPVFSTKTKRLDDNGGTDTTTTKKSPLIW